MEVGLLLAGVIGCLLFLFVWLYDDNGFGKDWAPNLGAGVLALVIAGLLSALLRRARLKSAKRAARVTVERALTPLLVSVLDRLTAEGTV